MGACSVLTSSARGPAPSEAGREWLVALDPAFERDDFGVVVLGRDQSDRRRLVVGPIRAIPSTGAFAGPLDEVVRLAEEYGARQVVTDQHAAAPVLEHLRAAGLSARKEAMAAR
jgi:hypothetical protein